MTDVVIDWATTDDSDGTIAVLREVADYRASLGQVRWDPESFTRDSVGAWIDRRELVVARVDDQVVATMLIQPVDLLFWPERAKGEAFYVHKLARLRSAHAAKGIVRRFITFAKDATRAAGRPYLRLDCAPDPGLCDLYAGLGFQRIDVVEIRPDFTSVRWEMTV